MSNLISLGSFNTTNGRTTGLGFSSGLDGTALIDSILLARTTAVTAIEDKITLNGKKSTAIGELSTLLDTLKTTADFLRGQTGVGKEDSDFFKHTTATVTSSTATPASNFLSVTSESGSTVNSYDIASVVTANAHALRKDGFTSDSTSVVGGALTFQAGTFTLRGVSVTLADGDSLKSIRSKINAVSATSGVIADIVQVSSTSFSLVLKASSEGVTNKITEYAAGNIQIGAASVAFVEQQTANDASFTLDGVAITRSTNVVNDVVSGITFSLLGDTAGETLNVNIGHDTAIIKTGINNFVTAYNNLKQFVSQQNKTDANGNFVDTAVLGDGSILRDVMTGIDAKFFGTVSGLASGAVKSLFDIGVDTTTFPGDDTTPKTTGLLVLDEAKFDAALAADFDAFRKVFATSFVASSADIGLYKTSNKATLNNYKLDIDLTRAVGDQVRVLDATTDALLYNADYSSTLITGRAGTTLEGVQFVYTGTSSQTITISSSQGIADKAFNTISAFLQTETGLIDTSIKSLQDLDETLQSDITKENIAIAAERQLLVDKFTQLEAIISQANSTLSFLNAQTNSNNANNR